MVKGETTYHGDCKKLASKALITSLVVLTGLFVYNNSFDKTGNLSSRDVLKTIATVSDKEKLKGQSFFAKAENGDTLLIDTNAKKASLYRESTSKVIEVAPIAIDTPAQGTSTPKQ